MNDTTTNEIEPRNRMFTAISYSLLGVISLTLNSVEQPWTRVSLRARIHTERHWFETAIKKHKDTNNKLNKENPVVFHFARFSSKKKSYTHITKYQFIPN